GSGEPRRLPRVPLVVADHVEPLVGERPAEAVRPPEPRDRQAHHEQQRHAAALAVAVPGELDVAVPGEGGGGPGHPGHSRRGRPRSPQCVSLSPMTQPTRPAMSSRRTTENGSAPVAIAQTTVAAAPMPTQTA